MPRKHLDLSAAEVPAKAAPKGLTDRQHAEYKAALAATQRWLTKLRRASNALAKAQKKAAYYEKLSKPR
jgi:hypothetical protein